MEVRRVVGIDLGIVSAHTAVVLAEDGSEVVRRRCVPTVQSFTELEQAALAGAPEGTRLEIVVEPTGPAWLPVAVFFGRRGHVVYRVSSQKAADLRRFLHRHAKSNAIDAETLARLPLVDPTSIRPVELPGAARATLDRRVRACHRLTRQIAQHKRRVRDLARQLMPVVPLGETLTRSDLTVLERYADPNALLRAGKARVAAVIARASHGHLGADRAEQWLAAARAAVELYGGDSAAAFADLAEEVATEIRMMRAAEAELDRHAEAKEAAYRRVDPEGLARTVPGVAEVGGPVLQAVVGRAHRFPSGREFRSYTGLIPRASETGETDRKGQPMSKAGSSLARTQLLRSAETARMVDPQLARIYYVQMVERGANHLKALSVVAAHLAERVWAVLARGTPYVVRDTDGRPVGDRGGPRDRPGVLEGPRGGPAAPPQQERGEGPSAGPRGTCSGQRSRRDNEAAFPTPDAQPPVTVGQACKKGGVDTRSRLGNQSRCSAPPDPPRAPRSPPGSGSRDRRPRPSRRRPRHGIGSSDLVQAREPGASG